jgi:putative two-component system response regulator
MPIGVPASILRDGMGYFTTTTPTVLIVGDIERNAILLERILATAGLMDVATTTEPWVALRLCQTQPPDLLLLDLQEVDGLGLLARLGDQIADGLPVVVLTADEDMRSRRRALELGARDYLTKPFDPGEVVLRVRNMLESRRLQLQLQHERWLLADRVQRRTEDLELARVEVLDRLAVAAEYRDDETHDHAQRIGRGAGLLARALGPPKDDVDLLARAAPLHDIGKIAIPDDILLKPGPLAAEEFAVMQTHAQIGAEMLAGSESPLLRTAEDIALTHHERWDGSGYPQGLGGTDIPLAGRIVAVVDVFDALSHERPYKPAWPLEKVLEEIRTQSGRQFDPEVTEAFLGLDCDDLLSSLDDDGGDAGAPKPEYPEAWMSAAARIPMPSS